jgi:pimeloyl-ACP methyl ester carboxylesterase
MNWRETEAELACAWAEEPVVIPSRDGDLIGIYTPAAPEAPPVRMCVVLLARPRFEYRRMTVDLARRLAQVGFACFRFDFHGWGDSEGESSPTNIDDPATEDVTTVIRYLTEVRGEWRLVLWGGCYGARAALSAFVRNPDAIEGLAFLSAPLNAQPISGVYNLGNLGRWLIDSEQWRQLILSRRARRRAANALRAMLRRSLAHRNWAESVSPIFEKHFRALVNARARALFLYGLEDDEYSLFRLAEPRLFGRLDAATRRRFEIVVWPGRVHSVLNVPRQQEIVAKSVSWISSLRPGATSDDIVLNGFRGPA